MQPVPRAVGDLEQAIIGKHDVFKAVICTSPEQVAEIRAQLEASLPSTVRCVQSVDWAVEIMNTGCSKVYQNEILVYW